MELADFKSHVENKEKQDEIQVVEFIIGDDKFAVNLLMSGKL
jgi:chemotaxis signal transduction protein